MKIASVGIIGISGFGNTHYKDLLREVGIGRVRPGAATIINQEEEAAKVAELKGMGCEIFSDYKEMLKKWKGKMDICMIPTGIHLHKQMTIDALNAGAHVFVEKPAAATVQDVDAMIAAEKKNDRYVAVGFQFNFGRQLEKLKQAILDGKIGKVVSIKASGLWPRQAYYYARNDWAGKLRREGEWVLDSPFHNAFSHTVMLLCSLAGSTLDSVAQPTAVTAELYRSKPIESCDTAAIRVETDTGIPLLLFVTHSCAKNKDPLLVVTGTKGSIQWPIGQHADVDGAVSETIPFDGDGPIREEIFDALFRKFLDPKTSICGLAQARAQVLIANGAFESSEIHTIPPGQVRTTASGEGELIVIANIDGIIRDAMKKEALFSEMKVPWAKPGTRFSLEGYKSFDGGKSV